MKLLLLPLALLLTVSSGAAKTLEEVIEEKVNSRATPIQGLNRAYSRERIAHWLPNSTQLSYSSNDNQSWKAWNLTTNVPFPIKSLYRDEVEAAKADYNKLSAEALKQKVIREIVEVHLDCAIPTEMTILLTGALRDQRIVSAISNSLYATGSVTQSDRVASDLQLRQLESQVRAQEDLAKDACARWFQFAQEHDDTTKQVVSADISNKLLLNLGLAKDLNKDVLDKKLIGLGFSKEKLWSKHLPDLEVGFMKSTYFDLYKSGGPPTKYTYGWSVGVTLPFNLPFYDDSAYVKEAAELTLEKLNTEYERSGAERAWEQAKKDWKRNSERLREISSRDLAMADVLVQGSLASYRTGKIDFSTMVLARRTKLDLQIEEIQLKAQRLLAKTVCLTECEQ